MTNTELKKHCAKITLNPFASASYSLGTISFVMIALLLVQVAMLAVSKSFDSLVVLLFALLASVCAEAAFYFFKRTEKHTWRISVIQGLIAGLLIPSVYPVYAVFAVVFFTLLLGKFVFGNFDSSWANLVALCIVVLYFLNPSAFPPFAVSAQELQTRNAALSLIQNGTVPLLELDSSITDFLNSYIFKFFGISIPDGYVGLFCFFVYLRHVS